MQQICRSPMALKEAFSIVADVADLYSVLVVTSLGIYGDHLKTGAELLYFPSNRLLTASVIFLCSSYRIYKRVRLLLLLSCCWLISWQYGNLVYDFLFKHLPSLLYTLCAVHIIVLCSEFHACHVDNGILLIKGTIIILFFFFTSTLISERKGVYYLNNKIFGTWKIMYVYCRAVILLFPIAIRLKLMKQFLS